MGKNPVYLWELASHDAEATVAFLKKVFEWEIDYDEGSGIHFIPAGEERSEFVGGGVFTLRKAKLPFLTVYIKVDDIEEKARLVVEEGGHIVEAPFEIGSGSKICLFNEPSGVTLAMIERAG